MNMKLEISWVCPNQESHKCSVRHCEFKKKYSRKKAHEKNKKKYNLDNKNRYHQKYKMQAEFKKKKSEYWKYYSNKKGKDWLKKRLLNRSKPILSELALSNKRELYKKWAKDNWDKRVEYAREYRRRKPIFGIRGKIAEARKSGDIKKLAEICLSAIIRSYE